MLIRETDTGVVRRASVVPVLWGLVVDYDGQEYTLDMPHATAGEWGFEVVGASPDELAAMDAHAILPTSPSLVMETPDGQRQTVELDHGPSLWFEPLGIINRDAIDDFPGRIVAAHPAVLRLLRLYQLDLPGLDELEAQHTTERAA